MSYLSYKPKDGAITAVPTDVVEECSTFYDNGTVWTTSGPGYNVNIYGTRAAGQKFVFQKLPIDHPAFSTSLGDFGVLEPLPEPNTYAIKWPV